MAIWDTTSSPPPVAPPSPNGSATDGAAYAPSPPVPVSYGPLGTSAWMQYLPAPYQGDAFLERFLLIFESIYGPIERMIDSMAAYFDPRVAPEEMLPWLASWVGMELDENWPPARRREMVLWAARLVRWRATRRGLREHLRVYTGRTPLIVENFDGLRVGQDASMGTTTQLGGAARRANWLSITVLADDLAAVDEDVVRRIIEFQKPAHMAYRFEIRKARPDEVEA